MIDNQGRLIMNRTAALFPFALAVAGLAVAACGPEATPRPAPGPSPVTMKVQMQAWSEHGGSTLVQDITDDLRKLPANPALLKEDSISGSTFRPMPDPIAQAEWSAILADYMDASKDTSRGNPSAVSNDLSDARFTLNSLLVRLVALGVA